MKTIYTTLPIYDKLSKQCYERGKHAGHDTPIPIVCPRHRLPSFQWLDGSDRCASVTTIELMTEAGVYHDITDHFTLPTDIPLEHDYFSYKGTTLSQLLDAGIYYLRLTMDNGYLYYSDWFQVDCIFSNLITGWTNMGYEDFHVSGTTITLVERTAGTDYIASDTFSVGNNENIKVIFNLTQISGDEPIVQLWVGGAAVDANAVLPGASEITLTSTMAGTAHIRFRNNSNGKWSATEVLVFRGYSEDYLILNFHNDCDLGDFLYHTGFDQTIWFKSEPMEMIFPIEEEGVKNGYGQFVRSFARQVKKYLIRTNKMPDFMVDVFHRLKLHDTIELINLTGDVNTVYNLEVEHEWLFEDKYYAKLELTFDYDESVVIAGCCNNLT
jgi:hypothetical protein